MGACSIEIRFILRDADTRKGTLFTEKTSARRVTDLCTARRSLIFKTSKLLASDGSQTAVISCDWAKLTDTSVVMGLEPRTKLELRVYIFKIVIIYTGMNAKGEWVVWPACV